MIPEYQQTYVYHEYPKWVTRPDGTQLIVQDAEEEARETAAAPSVVEETAAPRRRGRPPKAMQEDA